MKNIGSFDNYVSLGYFCSVAEDLEKLGLRNQSSPFDWVISDFSSVILLLENGFDGFLLKENLLQNIENRNYYKDERYNIYFYHDFNKYKSLDFQYDAVYEKYQRRINRLLDTIKKPTLFIRYISSENCNEQGNSKEILWIENNYPYIQKVIKNYNDKNEIIFIKNDTQKLRISNSFDVKSDEGDIVSRSPIFANQELYDYFNNVQFDGKEKNKQIYIEKKLKQKRKNRVYRIKELILKRIKRVYLHPKTYDKQFVCRK